MKRLVRTDSSNVDFIHLVKFLDSYLAEKDGDEHSFYHQYNHIDKLKWVVVVYDDDTPVGCGSIKEYSPLSVEVKRMYTTPQYRGKGIASMVLEELEDWAIELGYNTSVLETGKRQTEAVEFYKKHGYIITPNYGQYTGMDNSLCFEKKLTFHGANDISSQSSNQ